MQIILSDHNCEGQAQAIFNVLVYQGWLELVPFELRWFRDLDLSIKASDETVWRFCQENVSSQLVGARGGAGSNLQEKSKRSPAPPHAPTVSY